MNPEVLIIGGGTDLTSPSIPITAQAAMISFRNRYNTEANWDGGVLEISINGGAFQDILAAGCAFIKGGYNDILGANGVNNPLAGRRAWGVNSGNYITTTVQLPPSAIGQNVQFRWRFGADNNTPPTGGGWNIDTIQVVGSYNCSIINPRRAPFDFEGDGKTDISIFRPSVGEWWYQRSSDLQVPALQFGAGTDKITPADYTGDGKTDIAFWRPSTGFWFILRSEDNSFFSFPFGAAGDVPVPADFDGDGKTDISVFRPSNGYWYINQSSNNSFVAQQFGVSGDLIAPGDYDGDGRTNFAVFRPSTGYWYNSPTPSTNYGAIQFGVIGDEQNGNSVLNYPTIAVVIVSLVSVDCLSPLATGSTPYRFVGLRSLALAYPTLYCSSPSAKRGVLKVRDSPTLPRLTVNSAISIVPCFGLTV